MTGADYLLALDQGTTSSRAIAFDLKGAIISSHQLEFAQHYPRPGWVEHDPEEIFATSVAALRQVIDSCEGHGHPLAIGITNQRETTLLWDRQTGAPVYPAIVWQDRRTARHCARLRKEGREDLVTSKTGLLLDPYFSATKLAWILDSDPDIRARAEAGKLAFGTVDSFLLYRLGGGCHLTDVTNASRTMLFNIHSGEWDAELLELFNIPRAVLPEVTGNAGEFAMASKDLLGQSIPIRGMAGDQQAAAIGQGCIAPGSVKSTYGTGCFLLQNTGERALTSTNRLLTTIAYDIGGTRHYALEGSIFVAGAAVQWLRDSMGVIASAGETEALAAGLPDNRGVYLVPAFVGLGAPHWDADARAAIYGLTRDSGPAELARAALESVCYQTHDLLSAAARDGAGTPDIIRVDGGMVANDWLLQFLADILGVHVDRPKVIETTALGAAFLAGIGIGAYENLEDISGFWTLDRRFESAGDESSRQALLNGWRQAVDRTLTRFAGERDE